MRKETANTFTEGLVKDLHPLNTPANVLTDALNATLVTYDGNEFILQNDVGNGRVETARLPSGYIPVGMTEYGGIIYVASYNPLTGKSQLGSFPSPERQISTEELGRNFATSTSINTSNAYVRLDIYDENKKNLYRLNPGDKFIITSSGISKYFSGTYEGILKIHIGIVDKENNITYIEEDLEDPYIIDTNDIETSTKWQVFTSKTSGYLTIIVELLTIDTFNISRDIKLLSADVHGESISDTNPEFGLSFQGSYTTESNIQAEQFKLTSNLNSSPIYSTTPGLYIELADLRKTDVLDYKITPICKYGELSSFAVSGIIDFSALGTGFCKLTEWRYYADRDYLKVNWGLDFDVIKFLKVSEVKFTFHDMMEPRLAPVKFAAPDGTHEYYTCGSKDNYNGNFSEKIPFINSKTVYGLKKDHFYFVVIDINFVNRSGGKVSPKRYYKMVFTTGVFNEDFVKYETKDFAELNYPVTIDYEIETNLENAEVTPLPTPNMSKIMSQIKEGDKVYAGASTIYSVSSTFKLTPVLVDDNQFGELNWKATINENNEDYGLVVKMNDTYSYTVKDSPQYLGSSIENKDALENAMKAEFGENWRGNVEETKLELQDNTYSTHINGYIRRGIMATGIAEQSTELEAMQLTRVVRDTADLSEYISASIVGSPNAMTSGNHDHVEYSGNLPVQVNKKLGKQEYYVSLLPGDGSLVPSDGKTVVSNNLNEACNNELINSYNTFQLKHPIVYVAVDSDNYKYNDCWTVRTKTLNPNWQVFRDNHPNTHARADALLVAWKISDYSFIVINLGGVAAWRRDKDNVNKFEVDNCVYEYPQQGQITKLTTTDIIYNLLHNLYTLESGKVTVNNIKVPNSDTIVYHGTFNEDFTIIYKYGITLNTYEYNRKKIPYNLITYSNGNTKINFNPTDVKAEIARLLPQYTDIGDSLDNNLIIHTNIKTVNDLDYTISYSLGSTVSMEKWYSAFSKASSAEGLESITVDPEGNLSESPYKEDTIYIYSNGKYIPFDGKFTYPDGETMSVKSDFFKIRRTPKSSRPLLYINTTNNTSVINDNNNNVAVFNIDLSAAIYPKLKAWQ